MIYALPNGKHIHLSLEEYLNLTDDEIKFLVAYDYGATINNPNYCSARERNAKDKPDKLNGLAEEYGLVDDEVDEEDALRYTDTISDLEKLEELDSQQEED